MLVHKGFSRIGVGLAGGRGLRVPSVPVHCPCPLCIPCAPMGCPRPLCCGENWRQKSQRSPTCCFPESSEKERAVELNDMQCTWYFHVFFLSDNSLYNSPLEASRELRLGELVILLFLFQVTHKYMKLKVPREIGIDSQPLYLGIDISHHYSRLG